MTVWVLFFGTQRRTVGRMRSAGALEVQEIRASDRAPWDVPAWRRALFLTLMAAWRLFSSSARAES